MNTIVHTLIPSGPDVIWGAILWVVIIMDVITLFMQKRGTLQITIFLAISIVCAFINELGINNPGLVATSGAGVISDMMRAKPYNFANFMVGVLMFLLPLVVVGSTKTPGSRVPGLLAALAAGIYVFGRWVILH